MLLEILDAVPDDLTAEVWLPTDLDHGPHPLCAELGRLGHEVRHENLPILRRAYATPRGLWQLTRRAVSLLRLLRRERPREVYCTTSASLLGAPVARLAGVRRVVGHVQEVWGRSETAQLTLPALACGHILAISEAVAGTLPAVVRKRTTVVVNATPDPGRIDPPTPGHALRFLVASRWTRAKGLHTLLEAWGLLQSRLPATATQPELVVLGGQPPIGEGVDVPGLVATLPDPSRIRIRGEVPDIGSEIASADVVLMPSERPEPFGLVAIEAFARSRPVIASRAGGLVEIVTEAEDGWFFARGDAEGLARVLQRVVEADPETVGQAGKAARAAYDARFRPERFAADWRAAALEA